MMNQQKDFALWIMPEGAVYDRLRGLIKDLSAKFTTPFFEPHVTVLGSIAGDETEVTDRIVRLGRLVTPFRIRLSTLDYTDEYFRCLFIKVEKSKELSLLRDATREVFCVEDTTPYMPHLSLIYGNLTPDKKKKIVMETGSEFACEFGIRTLHLFLASVNTDPGEWRSVKEFPLAGA